MVSTPTPRPSKLRRWMLHSYRVGIFVFLLAMIHRQHEWYVAQERGAMKQLVTVEEVARFFPKAHHLSEWDPAHGGQNVFDENEERLGYVLQTSPEADGVVGFSGPTNTLIAFGKNHRIVGATVLRSDDTKEHLREVLEDESFLTQWNELDKAGAAAGPEIHAVSGATLTSMAIAEGIATRLGGGERKPRFPDEIAISEVRPFFETAESLVPVEKRPFLLQVRDANGAVLGYASRTSPHADHMIGYQGPSDLFIALDTEERIVGLKLRGTYDNAPYVKLMTDDEYFFNTFIGFELDEVSQIDMVDAGIDGVTGATKTSITVAEGLIEAALELTKIQEPVPPRPWLDLEARDVGTTAVVLAGLVIAFTRLRGKRWLRIAFQVVLVGYLGLVNADMLSQALLVGWAQNGIAWSVAPGLVLLSAAALIAPIVSGRQVYCTHLCPFGALQDWLGRRLPRQVGVKGRADRILSALPIALLVWVVIVAMGHLPYSLVGIEPFDAFVFRIAGWLTISIAIAGLIASLFLPRAYCRYGCPTGAMLKFLRLSAASDRLGRRNFVAAAIALVALGMNLWH